MKTFNEVTISVPDFGEVMVHLDGAGNPLRMYVYARDLDEAQRDREYLDLAGAELDLTNPKRYRDDGKNPAFRHARSASFVRRMWTQVLEQYYEEES